MNLTNSPDIEQSRQITKGVVHLPGLNALRFYASISVVVAHISNNFGELRTSPAHIAIINALSLDAQSAVNLFFVLSGFLITYLLLTERAKTGELSVKRFYIRRLLRIWPLYYLTVFIGFIAIPAILGYRSMFNITPPEPLGTYMVLLIMANFVTGLGPLGHLWSIGLEEQFYFAWPWVLKRRSNILRIVIGIVIVKLFIYPVVALLNVDSISNLYLGLRFECMSIGAFGAYIYYNQHRLLRLIYSLPAKLLIFIGILYLALVDTPLSEPFILITSFLFIIMILNLVNNSSIGRHLEIPVLNTLGKMSYGIYMYHYPLLYLVLITLNRWRVSEGSVYNMLLYSVTIGSTLILAYLSYRWYESPFLTLKEKYAIVPSIP